MQQFAGPGKIPAQILSVEDNVPIINFAFRF